MSQSSVCFPLFFAFSVPLCLFAVDIFVHLAGSYRLKLKWLFHSVQVGQASGRVDLSPLTENYVF
eukprot:6188530-Pleurochrysis_carterae.AAC.1